MSTPSAMAKPVRVLYVAGELTAGGYQRQLYLLLSRLDRHAVEPALAVWRYDAAQRMAPMFRALDLPLYAVEREGGRLRRLLSLARIVRTVRPEYVHSYCFYTNLPAHVASRLGGARGTIGSLRSDYWHERAGVGRISGRLCARYPRLMIANSEATGETVRRSGSAFAPRRLWVVPNGVDTDAFHPARRGSTAGAGACVQLLGVGRLTPEKRWPWLVTVLRDLQRDGQLPAWHMTICGEGEERDEVSRRIAELGLEEHVTLAGYQADVAGWLARSDVLLLPSAYEGAPNAVAEALSCGIPVLSTDVGDVRQLVRDGMDGYVVDAGDADAFRQRLRELITSPDLRQTMGQNGRASMLQTRSVERLVERTLQVYREAGWRIP